MSNLGFISFDKPEIEKCLGILFGKGLIDLGRAKEIHYRKHIRGCSRLAREGYITIKEAEECLRYHFTREANGDDINFDIPEDSDFDLMREFPSIFLMANQTVPLRLDGNNILFMSVDPWDVKKKRNIIAQLQLWSDQVTDFREFLQLKRFDVDSIKPEDIDIVVSPQIRIARHIIRRCKPIPKESWWFEEVWRLRS